MIPLKHPHTFVFRGENLTVLNLTDRHLLTDNSLTFGGFHYNEPRQIIGEVRYRFGY